MFKGFDPDKHWFCIFINIAIALFAMIWAMQSMTYEIVDSMFLVTLSEIIFGVLIGVFVCTPLEILIIRFLGVDDDKNDKETAQVADKPDADSEDELSRRNKKALRIFIYAMAYAYIIAFGIYCIPRHRKYEMHQQQVKEWELEQERLEARRKEYKKEQERKASEKLHAEGMRRYREIQESMTGNKSAKTSGTKQSSGSTKSNSTTHSKSGSSSWNSDAEEFAEEYGDEFDSWEDAYDYWEEEYGD